MDTNEVREIVEREAPSLVVLLGLEQWTITYSYDLREEDARGYCTRLYNYYQASIEFAPRELKTEEAVVATLRHELFHILVAPFDHFKTAVDGIVVTDAESKLLEHIWTHAAEQGIVNLERAWERFRSHEHK